MKKVITLALALMMVLTLAACGSAKTSPPGESTPVSDEAGENTEPDADPGENTEPDADPGDIEPDASQASTSENDPASPDSLDSVSDFLAIYGLTEEDVKPEHFLAFGDMTTDGQSKPGEVNSSAYLVIQADPEQTEAADIKAWFEQLCSDMQALSKDGKLHKNSFTIGTDEDEELSLETLYANPLWEKFPGTMWAYECRLQGIDVLLNVSTSYDVSSGEYKMGFTVFGK